MELNDFSSPVLYNTQIEGGYPPDLLIAMAHVSMSFMDVLLSPQFLYSLISVKPFSKHADIDHENIYMAH